MQMGRGGAERRTDPPPIDLLDDRDFVFFVRERHTQLAGSRIIQLCSLYPAIAAWCVPQVQLCRGCMAKYNKIRARGALSPEGGGDGPTRSEARDLRNDIVSHHVGQVVALATDIVMDQRRRQIRSGLLRRAKRAAAVVEEMDDDDTGNSEDDAGRELRWLPPKKRFKRTSL